MIMSERLSKQIIVPVIVFIIGIVFMNAWVTDDASITLRTIFHFLNGYGPNFNADIRVQSYTHPLWMLLLSLVISITQEYYLTTIVVSLACTAGMLFLMTRLADATQTTVVISALAILSLSKSFVEYSTSGLENPLGHLLIIALCVVIYHRTTIVHPMRWVGMLLAGIVLNRQDYVLLVAPLVIYSTIVWQERTSRLWIPDIIATLRNLREMSIGLIPLVLWFGFSTFYYGSPFPNTAYAKLNTYVDRSELFTQGLLYILSTIQADPLVLGITTMAAIVAYQSRLRVAILITAGIFLYGAYIITIGGDFMVGRFFSGVMVLCAAVIIIGKPKSMQFWSIISPLLLIGLFNPFNPWFTSINMPRTEFKSHPSEVVDERLWYSKPNAASAALLNLNRYGLLNPYAYVNNTIEQVYKPRDSEYFINCDCTGTMGIALGPNAILVDNFALFDPLVARLPAQYNPYWRIGHFRRTIPIGYMDSLQSGRNVIVDPGIAKLYDALRTITQGPLWDAKRLETIFRLNTGYYDHLINIFHYRFPDAIHINLREAAYIDSKSPVMIGLGGLVIHVEEPSQQSTLTISHYSNISLKAVFYKGTQQIATLPLPKRTLSSTLITSNLELPDYIRQSNYETIHLLIDRDIRYPDPPNLSSFIGRVVLHNHPNTPTIANAIREYNSDRTQPASIALIIRWESGTIVPTQHKVAFTHNGKVVQVIPNQLIDGTTVWSTETTLVTGVNRFGIIAKSNGVRIPPPDIVELTITPTMAVANALDVDPASLPITLTTGWYDQNAQWTLEQTDIYTRWYRLKLNKRGRWTQSPQFQVFTTKAGTYDLDINVTELVQPKGLVSSAPVQLIVNGNAQVVTLQKGQNRLNISLKRGMNAVQIRATSPSQPLKTLIPKSKDDRMVDMRITTLAVMPKTP